MKKYKHIFKTLSGNDLSLFLYENGVMPCPICEYMEHPEDHIYPYPFDPDTINDDIPTVTSGTDTCPSCDVQY